MRHDAIFVNDPLINARLSVYPVAGVQNLY
jgi:hypothetical protein